MGPRCLFQKGVQVGGILFFMFLYGLIIFAFGIKYFSCEYFLFLEDKVVMENFIRSKCFSGWSKATVVRWWWVEFLKRPKYTYKWLRVPVWQGYLCI